MQKKSISRDLFILLMILIIASSFPLRGEVELCTSIKSRPVSFLSFTFCAKSNKSIQEAKTRYKLDSRINCFHPAQTVCLLKIYFQVLLFCILSFVFCLFDVCPIPPFEEFWVAFLGRCIGEVDRTTKGIEHARVLYASAKAIMEAIQRLRISSS